MQVYRFCDKVIGGKETITKIFQSGLLTTYNAV